MMDGLLIYVYMFVVPSSEELVRTKLLPFALCAHRSCRCALFLCFLFDTHSSILYMLNNMITKIDHHKII